MADELQRNDTPEQEEEEAVKPLSDAEEEKLERKHEFSTPWQNSDLVLIIEDQKIHVHRVILEMTSPVLCHIFKETDSNKVPLLRTKASDFVELLRVIYPQFDNNITLDNIEHVYRLAEQYQIESAMKVCREYLLQVKKTTTNAMQILVTAQVCNVEEARKQCYEILKGLTVAELKSDQGFKDLDEKGLRNVLLPKAERLEKCLEEIKPQLVGLMDCVLYLWLHGENKHKMCGTPNKCPVHHRYAKTDTPMRTRMKCSACREMFLEMARKSQRYDLYDGKVCYYSGSGGYFDDKIVDVLQEMFSLLET